MAAKDDLRDLCAALEQIDEGMTPVWLGTTTKTGTQAQQAAKRVWAKMFRLTNASYRASEARAAEEEQRELVAQLQDKVRECEAEIERQKQALEAKVLLASDVTKPELPPFRWTEAEAMALQPGVLLRYFQSFRDRVPMDAVVVERPFFVLGAWLVRLSPLSDSSIKVAVGLPYCDPKSVRANGAADEP